MEEWEEWEVMVDVVVKQILWDQIALMVVLEVMDVLEVKDIRVIKEKN